MPELTFVPLRSWEGLRERIDQLIWPTDEEAREYHRLLRLMEQDDCYDRGKGDALGLSKQAHPPHTTCPCDLCRRYWEGFWTYV